MNSAIESQLRQAIVTIRALKREVEALRGERRPAIAVVGIGCRLPGGADDAEALWKMLMAGHDAIVEVPPERWDAEAWYDANPDIPGKMNSRWGGFLDGIDRFDAGFFELSAREAAGMDPQQRLLLEAAWQALEDACIAPDRLAASATGVFIGINGSEYYQMAMSAPSAIDAHAISGSVASVAAGRISYLLGLQGPALAVDTACSSSLTAVHLAVASLRAGESRVALAGGVYAVLQPNLSVGLSKLRMMAPDGRCKTFDASADGFVQGEGAAIVVLKRLDDAIADQDRILAVIRGSAANQDGRSSSLTAPSRPAQAAVIRAALEDAGVPASRIGYVEAHGTGTALGDPIEAHALADALGRERKRPLVLGALKSNIGHLGPAAGIAGMVKAVLAVGHGVVPPNLHLTTLNPDIAAEAFPLVFPAAPTPFPEGEEPRAAGVSSFGFSGTNVHVVIEEAPRVEPLAAPLPGGCAVLCVSARTEAAFAESVRRLVAALDDSVDLAAVSRASAFGRKSFEYRMAVVARSPAEARRALAAAKPVRVASRPKLAIRGENAALVSRLRDFGIVPAICIGNCHGIDAIPALDEAAARALGATAILDLSTLAESDPDSLLRAVCALHTQGISPDWRKVLGDGPRAALPHYPFERTRHWRDAGSLTPISAGSLTPILPGERVASPAREAQFRVAVGLAAMPWLGDHRVHGRAVVPGAFQLACLEGAWREYRGQTPWQVTDLVFPRPLVAPEEGALELWTLVGPEGEAKLCTRAGDRWIEHAQGRLAAVDGGPRSIDLTAARARCTTAIAPDAWREQLRAIGIAIGPAFQGLRELRQGNDEAIGRVSLPSACTPPPRGWHPALLDACLQVAGGTFARHTREGEALLPVGIDRAAFFAPLAGDLEVHARCTAKGEVLTTDLTLCDGTGRVVASIEGLHVRRALSTQLREDTCGALFHAVDWELAPLAAGSRPAPGGTRLVVTADAKTGKDLASRLAGRTTVASPNELAASLARTSGITDVIDLQAWSHAGTGSGADALRQALAACSILATRDATPRLWIVTRGAVLETANPAQAALWGLGATIALEHPALSCRRLDVDSLGAIALELAHEADGEDAIAWREGIRRAARIVANRPARATATRLRGTVLVTGGLGGIGREVARWSVAQGAEQVVLASRNAEGAEAEAFARSLAVPTTLARVA